MLIKEEVLTAIKNTVGNFLPETGGIIGQKDGIVCRFYFDDNSESGRAYYYPSVQTLNETIRKWDEEGCTFCGIVHSHGNQDFRLSEKDKELANAILSVNKDILEYVFFPIVSPATNDQAFSMKIYRIYTKEIKPEPYYIDKE